MQWHFTHSPLPRSLASVFSPFERFHYFLHMDVAEFKTALLIPVSSACKSLGYFILKLPDSPPSLLPLAVLPPPALLISLSSGWRTVAGVEPGKC